MSEDTSSLMVTIRCTAYNHEPYIRRCLEGFVIQKTNFRFEAIVHDDASTDGTAAIIKEYAEKYPDVIKPIFEVENQYSKCGSFELLQKIMDEHTHGKYVAFCEGDDYWTDPQKLQKQVDFLESHPDYVLCHGDALRYDADNNKYRGHVGILSRKHNLQETSDKKERFYKVLNAYYHIQTLTVLYRRSAVTDRPKERYHFMMGDTNLWLYLSQQGNFHYIDNNLGVYNIHAGSATHNRNTRARFSLSMFEMRCYYCEEYGYAIPNRVKKLYNRALINTTMLQKEILPPPIFAPFRRNYLQWVILKAILRRDKFYCLYSYLIYPVRKLLIYWEERLGIINKLIINLIS